MGESSLAEILGKCFFLEQPLLIFTVATRVVKMLKWYFLYNLTGDQQTISDKLYHLFSSTVKSIDTTIAIQRQIQISTVAFNPLALVKCGVCV